MDKTDLIVPTHDQKYFFFLNLLKQMEKISSHSDNSTRIS